LEKKFIHLNECDDVPGAKNNIFNLFFIY